jgi:hypothetical protein
MRKDSKKWLNGILYVWRKLGTYPQFYVERKLDNGEPMIEISFFEVRGELGTVITLKKQCARMLIRRLRQCLDGGSM